MSVEAFNKGRSAFEKLMEESDQLIMVEFVTPHCSGCKTLALVLHQLVTAQEGNLHLVEIDMTEEPDLAIELKVRSAPTVVLYKKKQLLANIAGLQPKQTYQVLVKKNL